MEYRLPFGEVAFYEGALFDRFQKYRPSPSLVSVTIHEAGGGAYTVRHAWPSRRPERRQHRRVYRAQDLGSVCSSRRACL